MDPIISPWLIYALYLADQIKILCSGILGIILILFGLEFLVYYMSDENMKDIYYCKKAFKPILILTIICGVLYLVIPDQKTLLVMISSSYITPDNVQGAEQHIIDFMSQLKEAINGH